MSICLNTHIENVKRNHPDYDKIYKRAYRKIHPTYTKAAVEKRREYYKKHKEEFSVSHKAWLAINNETIYKPEICSRCGKKRKILGHHPDYRFPFELEFVCYSCHKLIHNNEV